jgi:hypothetical protein
VLSSGKGRHDQCDAQSSRAQIANGLLGAIWVLKPNRKSGGRTSGWTAKHSAAKRYEKVVSCTDPLSLRHQRS